MKHRPQPTELMRGAPAPASFHNKYGIENRESDLKPQPKGQYNARDDSCDHEPDHRTHMVYRPET
eukprot:8270002-Karenia_brevis.AAC.1